MNEKDSTIALIERTLNKIRPFINRDGGDVKFVDFIDGIVYVDLLGACEGSALVNDTLGEGIEIILQEEVPGVLGVKLASDMPKKDN